ncbi:MAG: hypothetical protein SGI71_08755 [Verrucomicrobiota bacterium]|nr:hypothetical protein [Verrucomicrobiota bacterium]
MASESTLLPQGDTSIAGLKHARQGYVNLQDIIRFTDMKTGFLLIVVILLTFALLFFPVCIMFVQAIMESSLLPKGRMDKGLMLLFWFGGVAFGFLAFINALMSLVARTPNTRGPFMSSPLLKGVTTLFCVYSEKNYEEAQECVDRLSDNFTGAMSLEEYKRQILVVGAILSNKIKYHRLAIIYIALQSAAGIACVMFVAAGVINRS